MDRVCGVDVHRDTYVATVLGEGFKEARVFEANPEGMLTLKGWMKGLGCFEVAVESTGVFWVPLYTTLEEEFKVTVANARQVKAIPGRKTDQSDSEWLASLLKACLIKPSYVPEKRVRALRELTRLRVRLVQDRTEYKNRCHKVLERCNIRLSSKLSNVFGKGALRIVDALMHGESVEEAVGRSPGLRKKKGAIMKAIGGTLEQEDVFIMKECLTMIDSISERVKSIDAEIAKLVNGDGARLISAIPGVGRVAAPSILAEIGDVKRFQSKKSIASWAGLAPSVYQSGGKTLTGSITKRGSKWLRRIMVEGAQGASRARNSRLRFFFLRVREKKGYQVAIVALARKMLGIIWRVLTDGKEYREEFFAKKAIALESKGDGIPIREAIELLLRAGYTVFMPG